MAKVKASRPEGKTVTLSAGTKVSGPSEVVDRLAARDGGAKSSGARSSASK